MVVEKLTFFKIVGIHVVIFVCETLTENIVQCGSGRVVHGSGRVFGYPLQP